MNEQSLFDIIRLSERISNEMTLAWTRDFPHDIGVSEALVLSALEERGPEKSSVLASIHGYTKAAVTNIATKLVNLRAVERLPDPKDGRVVRLHITKKGRAMLQDAKETGTALREKILAHLTEEERLAYYTIQQKMICVLEEDDETISG